MKESMEKFRLTVLFVQCKEKWNTLLQLVHIAQGRNSHSSKKRHSVDIILNSLKEKLDCLLGKNNLSYIYHYFKLSRAVKRLLKFKTETRQTRSLECHTISKYSYGTVSIVRVN